MANYASVSLEFLSQAVPFDVFSIQIRTVADDTFIRNMTMTARTVRSAPGEYTIGASIQQTVLNLAAALNADHGAFVTTETVITNTVKVEIPVYDRILIYADAGTIVGKVFVTTAYEDAPAQAFEVSIGSIASSDTSQCTAAKFQVLEIGGVEPFDITGFFTASGVTMPYLVDLSRYSTGSRVITVTDTNNNISTVTIPLVRSYSIAGVERIYSLSGCTVIIYPSNNGVGSDLTLQYSIGGETYQTSPSFPGVLPGTYTAYMVDSLGCIKTYNFEVEELTDVRPTPYFNIEITNPLRFIRQGITPEFKNIDNTLFAELPMPNVETRHYRQPFNIGDVVKTQIKTNYRDIEVNVLDCAGEVVETIVPTLEIQNVGLKDKRDIYIKPGAPGKVNIAFITGNTYDPDTDAITGTYFIGTGRLPSFAQVGMLIDITSGPMIGLYQVEAIVFDSDISAWCCVIGGAISTPYTSISESQYNMEIYDIYEFSFTLLAGEYTVEIDATDDNINYPAILYKSEPIYFCTGESLVSIDYTADNGVLGIDYRTGIAFRLTFPGRFLKYDASGDDESFVDDSGNRQIQKSIYTRGLTLESSNVPMWLAEKIVIASIHPTIEVNGLSVTATEKPKVENKIDDNNPFYRVVGVFEQQKDITFTEEVGIISGQRYVLNTSENTILEV